MASRAHVMHDYGIARESERPRRQASYRSSQDPIELPRGRSGGEGSLAVAISAVIASSILLGGAYAIYVGPPPAMAITPTLPLSPSWQLDAQPQRAMLRRALLGEASAVPSIAEPLMTAEQTADVAVATDSPAAGALNVPPTAFTQSTSSPEVIIDDRYQLPQSADAPEPQPQTYPDPVTTPPDAIGPELDLSKPTPGLDPENPYRD